MRLATIHAMAAGLSCGGTADSAVDTMGVDTMGYDDEMYAVIGAAVQAYRQQQQGRQGGGGGRQLQRGGQPQQVPRVGNVYTRSPLAARGQNPPAMLRSFVGLGIATWTGTPDAGDRVLTIEPQEAFRGERLVIDVLASAGAAGIVLVRLLQVGVQPQQPDTEQPAPASMFARDVTYGHVDLQIARPGIKMILTLGITDSPGAGLTVTAAAGCFGEWVRG